MSFSARFLVVAPPEAVQSTGGLMDTLCRYGQVQALEALDGPPGDCLGVVRTRQPHSGFDGFVPRPGSWEPVGRVRRLANDQDVQRFAACCLAQWYCGSAEISEVLAGLELTPKQLILLALCCTDLPRAAIPDVIAVSRNTVKTRIRLLPRPFGKSGIHELVADVLHKAGITQPGAAPRHLLLGSRSGQAQLGASLREQVPEAWSVLPLSRLELPRQVVAFAAQEGLSTLRELLDQSTPPPNGGVMLALARALARLSTSGPPRGLAGCRDWQAVVENLPPDLLAAPIEDLPVLPRLHAFARRHRVSSLREVLTHPDLKSGKLTLAHTKAALTDLMDSQVGLLQHYDLTGTQSVAEALVERLSVLEPGLRDVVASRAGVKGPPEILETIGDRIQRSRERIRQLEAEAIIKLSAHGFAGAVESRVREVWRGEALALDDDRASWLQGNGAQEHVAQYVLDHFVSEAHRPFLVKVLGRTYLMPVQQRAFEEIWLQAKERLAALTYPATRAEVTDAVTEQEELAELEEPLMRYADEALLWDPHDEALAFGHGHKECVLAVLRAADEPIRIAQLEEHLGKGAFPEQVIYFERGLVGLAQHFPDFALHQQQLTPACVRKIRSAPERQWHARDLFGHLKSKGKNMPSWMTHWHVTGLLRSSPALHYLGRHCFTLATSQTTTRLTFNALVTETLASQSQPMTFEEILAAIEPRRAVTRQALRTALARCGVTVGEDRWRLRGRRR